MALTTHLPYRDLVTVAIVDLVSTKPFEINVLPDKSAEKTVQIG
ncbi:hypothetical protein [Stenotrophomonas sp. NPDC078853]